MSKRKPVTTFRSLIGKEDEAIRRRSARQSAPPPALRWQGGHVGGGGLERVVKQPIRIRLCVQRIALENDSSLLARRDGGVVGDGVAFDALERHLTQQPQRLLPLAALLASLEYLK